ncbi:hypothetical protein [Micromonospora schwarzwaldensis]|uniref:hypothetical protein n=1 Tax=Micromonospora sp. DSM 45708 TaxID=3111767 RepID=UPI0031D6C402
MKIKRGVSVATAALTTIAGLAVAAPASAAAGASRQADVASMELCNYGHYNGDADFGYVNASALARRSGPYLHCDSLGQAARGTKIYYHCFEYGSAVTGPNGSYSSWTYGRIAGTTQEGWFADAYLSDLGSAVPC